MNSLNFILAVSGPEAPAHTSGTLEIVGVGFIFVLVVLALLAMVTAALGAIFIRFDARLNAKVAAAVAAQAKTASTADPEALDYEDSVASSAPAPAPALVSATSEEEDPALIAVIAAAVHSVIGDRAHRIVSIRPGGPGWAQEGRRQIFSSHRVR